MVGRGRQGKAGKKTRAGRKGADSRHRSAHGHKAKQQPAMSMGMYLSQVYTKKGGM